MSPPCFPSPPTSQPNPTAHTEKVPGDGAYWNTSPQFGAQSPSNPHRLYTVPLPYFLSFPTPQPNPTVQTFEHR
ncbi:hypothetical protein K435DRAFT_869323 [Dendrothele bispora CBS 962.96]|uniref:Uncharacterized protein n=1 Tax=Dendrothele bispora (strain CBS 962.96) TaxID=1314807 RepID=A0A4S8LAT3_DENBC|nr:hypothetical protein K435DRAFT_869323 [Dendrothele bispora CBS 962.96]